MQKNESTRDQQDCSSRGVVNKGNFLKISAGVKSSTVEIF